MERYSVPLLLWINFFFCCSFFLQISDSHALILEGTPGPDELIATVDESPYDGIISYAGDDTIEVQFGAVVSAFEESTDPEAHINLVSINAGSDNDLVTNWGSISATADAIASSLSDPDTPPNVDVNATAILAGGGIDEVVNNWIIDVLSDALITSVSLNPNAEGEAVLDADTIVTSQAVGIDGDGDDDTLTNSDTIRVYAEAEVNDVSVILQTKDVAIADASVTSRAEAIGMQGGDGIDIIQHHDGLIEVDATAETLGVATSGTLQKGADVDILDLQAPIADVSIRSEAISTGISGGMGNDDIDVHSSSMLHANATAKAENAEVIVSLQKKTRNTLNISVAPVKADTYARATAVGIEGGEGDDVIDNLEEVQAFADAAAGSTLVEAKGQLSVRKAASVTAAMVDANTTAVAKATAISGNQGIDHITNAGTITTTAHADANSVSVVAEFKKVDQGLSAGLSYANTKTIAEATGTGISGGAGKDTIINTGSGLIEVTADNTNDPGNRESTSASVTLTVEGSFKDEWSGILGGSVIDGSTEAVFDTVGIDAGNDNDAVTNGGRIAVTANPDAASTIVGLSLSGVEEGLAVGFTYIDAKTSTEAFAIGISGGSGDDTIFNADTGEIVVAATPTSTSTGIGVTVSGATKETGIVGGAAMADSTTRVTSELVGLSGGDGVDTLTNAGSITINPNTIETPVEDSIAHSTGVLVNVGAALGDQGLVGGFSFSDSETSAQATAVGMDGGGGNDALTNTGDIVITTRPKAESLDVNVTIAAVKGLGVAAGAALTNATTSAESTAIGMDGGEGEDVIDSSGNIWLDAEAVADSTSVGVNVTGGKEGMALGASYTDATTTAETTAFGIKDSSGRADVENTGSIDTTATTESYSTSVGFTLTAEKTGLAAGVSLADLATQAIAESYGIDTAEEGSVFGDDTIDNLGTIESEAVATTEALSVTAELSGTLTGVAAGLSASRTDVLADASTTGLRSGRGNDTIINNGVTNADGFSLDNYALATSKSTSVTTTITAAWKGVALGTSLASANTEAAATADGIAAGEGNDTVTNATGIRANADSNVTSDVITVNAAFSYKGVSLGAALSQARTDSDAQATGIDGGNGNDDVTNQAALETLATAFAKTNTVTVNFTEIGEAIADVSSTATTVATGLDGGRGVDSLSNQGDITVKADSTADDTSTSVNVLAGYLSGDVSSTATATAAGIRGDAADDAAAAGDTIENREGATIDVESHALLKANSYEVQGGGAAFADTTGTVESRAAGIVSGAGADALVNQGSLDVVAHSNADMSNMVMQLSGVAAGKAGANLTTEATGVDAGNGVNTITNESGGVISVRSKSNAIANTMTLNFGVSLQRAAITAGTFSTGILSGDDADEISNYGDVAVAAATSMGAASGDFSLFGLTFNDSVTQATVVGIDAGGGDDVIFNGETGRITVGGIPDDGNPMAFVAVDHASFSFAKVGLGFLSSKASAWGILGNYGDDTIVNAGTISISDDDWMCESRAFGFQGNFLEFFSITGVGATAKTFSTGISGGQGNDEIVNQGTGVVDVRATAYAVSSGAADVSLAGEPSVFANSKAEAEATGISGGPGDDTIFNFGEVTAEAEAQADTTTDSWVGWGNPTAESKSTAIATARGIDAGQGRNLIHNEGEILADSTAGTDSFAKADSNIADTDSIAESRSEAFSYGIAGADDGNTVINVDSGAITAIARARTFDPQTGMQTKAETDEFATARNAYPARAYSAGIHLGSGDDAVDNQGSITAQAFSDAGTYAYSNSYPNPAKSEARANGTAIAIGIAVGEGSNTVVNSGQVDVDAVGDAFPMAYSFSRDETSETIAVADATATALGIQGNGFILNAQTEDRTGTIDVTARTSASADTDDNDPDDPYTEAEKATAEATLTSTAIGIATMADSNDGVMNRIENQGNITVVALAGVDAAGDLGLSAYSHTDIISRDCRTDGIVVSEVAATGIQANSGDVDVINTGEITVAGRSNAQVVSNAYSRDQNPTAVARATAMGTTQGIHTGAGDDYVGNTGTVNVMLITTAIPWALANSVSRTTDTDGYAGSRAIAKGIAVGAGHNTVRNEEGGSISVESRAGVNSLVRSDENATAHIGTEEDDIVESMTVGIEAGDGNNGILNQGDVQALSVVDILSRTEASSTTDTAYSTSLASGAARAFGIASGDGNNIIINESLLTARAENQTPEPDYNVIASRPSSHLDQAFAYAGGAEDFSWTADAVGIEVGHGNNVIENHGEMLVESIIYPRAVASADTSSSTNYGYAYAGGTVTATGILAGNGRNQITNFKDTALTVSATADATAYGWAENHGRGFIGNEETPGLISAAIGIQTGSGENTIHNYGNMDVEAFSTGLARARASTVSQYSKETVKTHTVAEATGILTGDGSNHIFNSGALTATATTNPTVQLSWDADDQEYHATGVARAIGILTGSGDDRVENTGTIDVQANVTIRSAYLAFTGETSGILTGAGNDMVINSGTILTETILNIYPNTLSTMGVGIDTGAGDDAVHLLDQSLVEGNIYHGEGNDTLLLRGTPQVMGQILGGTGEDLLVFDGPGSFEDPIFEFEAAAKTGSGTFTVNNMPAVNQLEAIEGTLEIAHNYTLASDGSFTALVNNDGNHGQLKVDGEAGLAGELRVVRGGGLFLNGDSFDILVADSVIDDFDSQILPEPTPLLHFETTTQADRVEVEAIVENSTSVTENNVEMAIAQYVDRIMPTATGELRDYLAIFQSLSREDFKKAFAGFSPESYEKSTRTSLDASNAFTQALQKRMGILRSGSTAPKGRAETDALKEPLLLAYNGTDIGDLTGAREQAQAQRKWGLWLDVFGQWGDQETEDGYTGYDYKLTGCALGFDYLFADSFIAGLGLGHSQADVDLDQDAGAGDIESLFGSLYGSFFTDRLYVDTALSFGQQDYENYRNLVIGPLQGAAASEHEATLFSANLGGGYYFSVNNWQWGPFGSLLYTQLDEDGFTETGAGPLNLTVESRETESLLSWLGLRAGRAFRFDKALLLPEVSLAWLHDFDIDDSVTASAIAGAPGSSFSIPGQPVETDGVNAGASLSLISKSGYRASLKYGGDFRGSYTAHALYGEIRIEF